MNERKKENLDMIKVECVVCSEEKEQDEMVSYTITKRKEIITRYKDYCVDCKDTKKKCASTNGLGCNNLKGLDEFNVSKTNKYNRHPYCKECRKKNRKKINNKRPKKGTLVLCTNCNKRKDESLFSTDISSYNGLQSGCKECSSDKAIVYLNTKKGKLKKVWGDVKTNAKRNNIDIDIDYNYIEELFEKQNGLCNLSGIEMTTKASKLVEEGKVKHPYNVCINRIDQKKGYIEDNVSLICTSIKDMKSDLKDEEFVKNSFAVIKNTLANKDVENKNQFTLEELKELKNIIEYRINDFDRNINKIIPKKGKKIGGKKKKLSYD